jgi:hypothetical protein
VTTSSTSPGRWRDRAGEGDFEPLAELRFDWLLYDASANHEMVPAHAIAEERSIYRGARPTHLGRSADEKHGDAAFFEWAMHLSFSPPDQVHGQEQIAPIPYLSVAHPSVMFAVLPDGALASRIARTNPAAGGPC